MPDNKQQSHHTDGTITRTDDGGAAVLIIDEDPLMLTAMGSVMDMQGYRAVMARTEQVAVESIQTGQFDVIVLSIEDLRQGCDFARRLRTAETTQDVPIIFLVPRLSSEWCVKLGQEGGVFSIVKPFEPDSLIELVDKALWMPHVAKSRLGARSVHMLRQKDWISLPNVL